MKREVADGHQGHTHDRWGYIRADEGLPRVQRPDWQSGHDDSGRLHKWHVISVVDAMRAVWR